MRGKRASAREEAAASWHVFARGLWTALGRCPSRREHQLCSEAEMPEAERSMPPALAQLCSDIAASGGAAP